MVATLGDSLRQARLDKGVSLADASQDTHIRRDYLEALEAEDIGHLPPPVYTRGFLRSYAEYLGLNPQAILDLYHPAAVRRDEPHPLRPAIPRVAIPREIPIRPLIYLLVGIALVVGAVLLWTKYQQIAAEVRDQDPTARAAARSGTPTFPPRVPTPLAIAIPSPSPSATSTATPAASPTPAATSTPVTDGILVEFRATARVYVEAAVDGSQVFADTLQPGAQQTLPLAKQLVVMRVSNGSAVQVTVNGRAQPVSTETGPVEMRWQR